MKKLDSDKRDGLYEIPPAECQELFDNRDKNRPFKQHRLDQMASDMKAGLWHANGATVVLMDGKLIDGQHRVRAAAIAGLPLVTYVIYLTMKSVKAFDTIDSGCARSNADALSLNGYKHAALMAATVKWALWYEEGFTAQLRATRGQVRLRADKDGDALTRSCVLVASLGKSFYGLIPTSVVAFSHFKAAQVDPEKADRFVQLLASGEGLGKNNAVLTLRNRMIQETSGATRLKDLHKLAFVILAWNAFLGGRQIHLLRWRDGDAFPAFAPKAAHRAT